MSKFLFGLANQHHLAASLPAAALLNEGMAGSVLLTVNQGWIVFDRASMDPTEECVDPVDVPISIYIPVY